MFCRDFNRNMVRSLLTTLLLLPASLSLAAAPSLRGAPVLQAVNLGFSNSAGYQGRGQRRRRLADFEWMIEPTDGYPNLNSFLSRGGKSVIEFKYNFTGSPSSAKELEVTLYRKNCLTLGPEKNAFGWNETIQGNQLDVQLGVNLETIGHSPYYSEQNVSSAEIAFCLRVDYKLNGESINFHETKVYVGVDLTEGFQLASIAVNKTKGSNATAEANIACDVREYFCDDNFNEVLAPVLKQGDYIQGCVESTGMYNIRDVIEANLDQDQDYDGSHETHEDLVTDKIPEPLTAKSVR
jgi:hypothetical protein